MAGKWRAVTIGQPLFFYETVDSTNTSVRRLADAGAVEGTVVWAEQQSAGRGRHGRGWVSPPGKGLWFSVLLRPTLPAGRVPLLTLVAAVSVLQGIREATGFQPTIKWPNDLLAGPGKLAGLLAEAQTNDRSLQYVVLGVGVNVNQTAADFPAALAGQATSLRLARGKPCDRRAILDCVLKRMDSDYRELCRDGPARLLDVWRAHCTTLGQTVRVTEADSGFQLLGRAVDIDDNGALVVVAADGRRLTVLAGDVTLASTGGG